MPVEPIRWEDGRLSIIDQTVLPLECNWVSLSNRAAVWRAIKTLQVRGAPAIGVCAAFGILVAIREKKAYTTRQEVAAAVNEAADFLASSRPTAVNLFWALDRMRSVAAEGDGDETAGALIQRLEKEAQAIFEEDKRQCRAIGDHGAALIGEGDNVLTHCNAGSLATSSYGTALAAMFRAHELGRKFHVYADETRPLLQGARLTAWELMEAGIDVTVICDNAAAQVMREGKVQLVIVGADRIAANGDTANKIGTYGLAVAAEAHTVPFYVAAPSSTFDLTLAGGDQIPIEQRDPDEVTSWFGRQTAPDRVKAYNPAFDVTPARLIAGIVTEKGIIRPPYDRTIADTVAAGSARGERSPC